MHVDDKSLGKVINMVNLQSEAVMSFLEPPDNNGICFVKEKTRCCREWARVAMEGRRGISHLLYIRVFGEMQ